MPWLYVRRVIASTWHCTPLEVEWINQEAPAEIALELKLMAIDVDEAKH